MLNWLNSAWLSVSQTALKFGAKSAGRPADKAEENFDDIAENLIDFDL